MSLEEQIKQASFANLAEKAFVNISFTQSYLSSEINTSFKEHNVSIQQYNVMRILKGQDPKPVSMNDISDRMIDKMSNASRLVEKLRTKELIKREQCLFEKRQLDICLTEKGKKMLKLLTDKINAIIADHSHLSEEEFMQLNSLLDKLRKE